MSYDELGLSPKGHRQAIALGERLARARTPPSALYTSGARRARETAAALAAALGIEAALDDGLREVYLGPLLVADVPAPERARSIRDRLDELAAIAQRDGSWNALPEAERAAAVRARVTASIQTIAERHAGRHVALVSHAGTINAYVAGIIGASRDFFFPAGNTSLSSVSFANGTALLIRLNDTAHLESANPA